MIFVLQIVYLLKIILEQARRKSREKGRWLENAHLQPAAALPVTKLPKSPEAASRTCREKNVLLTSKTNASENKPEIFIKDS